MADRIAPKPDLYASCPSDGRVLDYYSGVFESVYVLLHPFIKPISISSNRFIPATYPTKQEIVETCEAVTWAEVAKGGDFASLNDVDIALRTRILGLKAELSRSDLEEKLELYTDLKDVVPPAEGEVPGLLENRLLESAQSLGYQWLWVGDEFCTERKLWWIDDLKSRDECGGHANIFTPDKSLLITTHWDSHFSFVCSNRRRLDDFVAHGHFEGFYCEPSTEVYWSVSPGAKSAA